MVNTYIYTYIYIYILYDIDRYCKPFLTYIHPKSSSRHLKEAMFT